MRASICRNILVAAGAYYLSFWLAYPLDVGYRRLIGRPIYEGNFGYAVVMPLVTYLPYAIAAFGVGLAVVLLVESRRQLAWTISPVALYVYFGYAGQHWEMAPSLVGRISETVRILYPALACLLGGLLGLRRRSGVRH